MPRNDDKSSTMTSWGLFGHPVSYELRSLKASDRDLLFRWRNSDSVRAYMFTDHLITREEHDRWFDHVQKDPSAACFVFECNGKPVGIANFTGLDADKKCSWGFYLGETDVPSGSGSALARRALQYAFDKLGVEKIVGEVFAFNERSIKLHKKCGFEMMETLRSYKIKNGQPQDVIRFQLTRQAWDHVRI
jgi:UDP-4-amino-4,6-dideoxy-N-acetyl-beta-L-altrosamine N-acetyltransferase